MYVIYGASFLFFVGEGFRGFTRKCDLRYISQTRQAVTFYGILLFIVHQLYFAAGGFLFSQEYNSFNLSACHPLIKCGGVLNSRYIQFNSTSHYSLKITSRIIILHNSVFFISKTHKVLMRYAYRVKITFHPIKKQKNKSIDNI